MVKDLSLKYSGTLCHLVKRIVGEKICLLEVAVRAAALDALQDIPLSQLQIEHRAYTAHGAFEPHLGVSRMAVPDFLPVLVFLTFPVCFPFWYHFCVHRTLYHEDLAGGVSVNSVSTEFATGLHHVCE